MCNLHYLGNFFVYGRLRNTHQCTEQHHSRDISIVCLVLLCLLQTIHCIGGLHFFSLGGILLERWWSISLWMMLSPLWWPNTPHSTEHFINKPSTKSFLNLGDQHIQKMQRSRWYPQNHSVISKWRKHCAFCVYLWLGIEGLVHDIYLYQDWDMKRVILASKAKVTQIATQFSGDILVHAFFFVWLFLC